jgi:hypothetical protein
MELKVSQQPCTLFAMCLTALFGVSDYVALNERMVVNNELEGMWKEVVKVLCWHLPGGAEKNHKKCQSV